MSTISQLLQTKSCLEIFNSLQSGATIDKVYATGTQKNLEYHKKWFKTFCEDMLKLPDAVYETDVILTYLVYKFQQGNRYASIKTKWHNLSSITKANQFYDKLDTSKIQAFLSNLSKLPVTDYIDKPVANISDVKDILKLLWTESSTIFTSNRYRVQLAFFILVSGITASRPGALVYGSTYQESLCYQDLELRLETVSTAPEPIWVLIIAFHYRKGRRGRECFKFPLRDLDNDPCYWPVALVIALAFYNKAFKSPHLTSPVALASLKVCINIYKYTYNVNYLF